MPGIGWRGRAQETLHSVEKKKGAGAGHPSDLEREEKTAPEASRLGRDMGGWGC